MHPESSLILHLSVTAGAEVRNNVPSCHKKPETPSQIQPSLVRDRANTCKPSAAHRLGHEKVGSANEYSLHPATLAQSRTCRSYEGGSCRETGGKPRRARFALAAPAQGEELPTPARRRTAVNADAAPFFMGPDIRPIRPRAPFVSLMQPAPLASSLVSDPPDCRH